MATQTGTGTDDRPLSLEGQIAKIRAYAATSPTTDLGLHSIERRAVGPRDVKIRILYCGVCHSDLHQARNEWQNTMPTSTPAFPGTRSSAAWRRSAPRSRVSEGDLAAVGCLVDSCRTCASCREGLEQFCENTMTLTYNSADAHGGVDLRRLLREIVVDEDVHAGVLGQAELGGDRAAAVRRHHDLLAAAPLEGGPGRRSAWSASAASATWR